MSRRRTAVAIALAAVLLGNAPPGEPGTVVGRVTLAIADADLARVGPVVVFLEPLHGGAGATAARHARVSQRGARFSPDFLALPAGATVDMRNDDDIFHNVFSYSTPNDFDLGLYPRGERRDVRLRYPGVVRIYCSIHESMNGTIFVAPTDHFAVADADGRFRIEGVPPGRYRARAWNRLLPRASAELRVPSGGETGVVLRLGEPEG